MKNLLNQFSVNDLDSSKNEEYEILKLAMEQMNIKVFVYDTLVRKIYFFTSPIPDIFGEMKKEYYLVDDILKKNIIDPQYCEAFKSLFEKIEQGARSAEAWIRFQGEARNIWNHVSLFNCFDENKTTVRAIGAIQNISGRAEAELLYSKEQKYRLAMMADFHRIYEINVTKDRFIRLNSIQDSTDYDSWDTYTKSMNHLRETRVYKDDWETFLAIASKDKLLQGFYEGKTEFYCEYRSLDENGNIVWSSSATHLLRDPVSYDIKGFIYVKDIDKQKKRELELEQQAERDPLTGIYNRRTAEKLISKLLQDMDETKKQYAFLTIDMDDFKLVNDKYGHVRGDFLLKNMTQKISAILTDKDIFARLGGDEFIVFLDIGGDESRLQRISELIISTIQDIYVEKSDSYHASASIGISKSPEWGVTFDQLYDFSDQALYCAKQRGKGCIEIYH